MFAPCEGLLHHGTFDLLLHITHQTKSDDVDRNVEERRYLEHSRLDLLYEYLISSPHLPEACRFWTALGIETS